MKRHAQLVVLLLFIFFFAVVASWYWLRQEATESPLPGPSPFSSNVMRLAVAPTNIPLPGVRGARPLREVVGIGAVIHRDANTGANMITGVVPNSPAAAAGLAGDFIIRKIDDTLTDGMSLQECVNLVRGPEGTKVRLELFDLDANETKIVELTRQKLQLQPVRNPILRPSE